MSTGLRRPSSGRPIAGGTVVITGAGSGIGRALAQRLSRAGSPVALCDVDGAGLKETAASLRGPVLTQALDVSDGAAVKDFAMLVRAWSPAALSAVFNNAGVGVASSVLNSVPADDDWLHQINFGGV